MTRELTKKKESTIDGSEENSFFISFKLLITSLQKELNSNVQNGKFIEELLSDVTLNDIDF